MGGETGMVLGLLYLSAMHRICMLIIRHLLKVTFTVHFLDAF